MAVDRNWGWIGGLVLAIGGLILVGGLALGLGSLRLVLHGEPVDGEVVEMRREGDMYAPVVRFRLASGESRTVKDLGTGAPDFAVGDRVAILYMPQDPAWMAKYWWRRLTAMRSSQNAGVTSSRTWRSSRAALLTRTVTGPSQPAMSAIAA